MGIGEILTELESIKQVGIFDSLALVAFIEEISLPVAQLRPKMEVFFSNARFGNNYLNSGFFESKRHDGLL